MCAVEKMASNCDELEPGTQGLEEKWGGLHGTGSRSLSLAMRV